MSDNVNRMPFAASRAIDNRIQTKAMQTLMGMITAMVADRHLHDNEIMLLRTWLAQHAESAAAWPGCAIAAQVDHVLADGVITEGERAHLLNVLSEMANTDFSATGSAAAEPLQLPIDDSVAVNWVGAGVVHTGTFVFGTRSQCERLTAAMGGRALGNVTKASDVLVIGTRVSPGWVNESYGRKIMAAAELQRAGHGISIVSERYWFEAAQALHAPAEANVMPRAIRR